MLLIVLGAGASYDSIASRPVSSVTVDVTPGRPPLAQNLFDERVTDYLFDTGGGSTEAAPLPELLPILPALRHRAGNMSVEAVLQRFQQEGEADPERYRQLAAVRYYLNQTLWRINEQWRAIITRTGSNYHTLLDHIRHHGGFEKIALVTFNYDVLLEDALRHMRIPLDNPAHYTLDSRYKVFKLHGSVNWGHPIKSTINRQGRSRKQIIADVIAATPTLEIDTQFVQLAEPILSANYGTNFVPALAIPLQVKDRYECPPEHVAELDAVLPSVSHMLVVGWSATEQHFLEMLAKRLPKGVHGMIACGDVNAATAVRSRLEGASVDVDDFHIPSQPLQQFTDLLVGQTVGDFLSEPQGRGR